MIILGIDPGLARTGYALIKEEKNNVSLIECGCVETKPGVADPERLLEIKKDLSLIIKKFRPDLACVETLFFTTNAKTAFSVGQARGVILLTCAENKIKLLELTPLQVKIATTGYGKADKSQVQESIKMIMKLKKIPEPDDAADALAIAWAGVGRMKF